MIYTKPTNVSYTDMAIWIDANAYEKNCDDAKLYEYLYHLVLMLAHQHKYFSSTDLYDDFGLFSASKLFMRLRNPKQFSEDSKSSLYRIKSILNYIKTVIYPYKVDFEQDYYSDSPKDSPVLYTSELGTYLSDESDICDRIEFQFTVDNISNMARLFLKRIPYKRNSYEWNNIYTSCILTLLDSITPTADVKISANYVSNEDLDRIYKNLDTDPILFHLDNSMSNYIKVLVRQLRHFIAKQLTLDQKQYIDPESAAKSMIIATLQEEE